MTLITTDTCISVNDGADVVADVAVPVKSFRTRSATTIFI